MAVLPSTVGAPALDDQASAPHASQPHQATKSAGRLWCVRLRAFLFDVGADSPSGQSFFNKVRFASSLFSPFAILAILAVAKDIYLEKFGADAATLGVLTSVLAFYGPVNETIIGALQDRSYLARCFPLLSWGRRAPWLLTSLFIAAAACGAMYLPPSTKGGRDDYLLHGWFFMCSFAGLYAVESCIMAFKASRNEIFPSTEERIVVECCTKYAAGAGAGAGGVAIAIVTADASAGIRLSLVLYIVPVCLFSLTAVGVMRKAKALSTSKTYGNTLSVFKEACIGRGTTDAIRRMLQLKFSLGAYGGTVGPMLIYYVTYCLLQTGWERAFVLATGAMTAGALETAVNIVMVCFFGRGRGAAGGQGERHRKLCLLVTWSRAANAVSLGFVVGVLPPSVPLFIVWCALFGAFKCSFSYWRIAAENWVADEDCYLGEIVGRRRQATIFGTFGTVAAVGFALSSNLLFIGLSVAGLQTTNCERDCDEGLFNATATSAGDCAAACLDHMVREQPESLRRYIRLVLGALAPCLELSIVYHAFRMPIKGQRLRRLLDTIESHTADTAAPDPSTSADLPDSTVGAASSK